MAVRRQSSREIISKHNGVGNFHDKNVKKKLLDTVSLETEKYSNGRELWCFIKM